MEQLQLAMLKLETNKPGRRFTLSPYLLFNQHSLNYFFVRINCRANTSFGTFASRDFAKVLNNKVSIFVEDHQ